MMAVVTRYRLQIQGRVPCWLAHRGHNDREAIASKERAKRGEKNDLQELLVEESSAETLERANVVSYRDVACTVCFHVEGGMWEY
jgi:hypothetical protein